MEEAEGISEQRAIEKYIQQFYLEDCLDEILNQVVTERPANPYVAIARLIELKTVPEIMDVRLYSTFQKGFYSVRAILSTNVGNFEAVVPYKTPTYESIDYSIIEGKLKEVLVSLDPCKIKQVDDAVATIADINPAESMAVSIAACRAAAKLQTKKLHEVISDFSGTKAEDCQLPLPVLTFGTRHFSGLPDTTQTVHAIASRSSTLDGALDKYKYLIRALVQHEKVVKPVKYSIAGTAFVDAPSVEEVARIFTHIIRDEQQELGDMLLGMNLQREELVKSQESANASFSYATETAAIKNGTELVEQIISLWQELEFIALGNPLSFMDYSALRHLRKRIQETIYDIKNAGGDKMKYICRGVGNDPSCNLQIPIDGHELLKQDSDLIKHFNEFPINTARINLLHYRNLSEVVEAVKAAKKLHLAIIVSCCTQGNFAHLAQVDTFAVDLAIGIGALQLHLDGLYASETSEKINRLQEIQRETDGKIPFVAGKFHAVTS